MKTTTIKGAFVYVTEERAFRRLDIVTEGTRIKKVGQGLQTEGGEAVLEGKYIIPGLVDVHTHGRGGYDFNSASQDEIKALRRSYAECGTTTVMATLASYPYEELLMASDRINMNREETPGYATVAGIHLEGRYLSPEKRGTHNPKYLAKGDPAEADELSARMMPLPLHVSCAPEVTGYDFVRGLVEKGITVGLAHSNATYDEAVRFVESGGVSFTHTFNAMRAIHHREPGNAMASVMCDGAYSEIICDGMHVHPAMIRMLSGMKPDGKLVLITDSMEAAGCPDGEYSIAGERVTVKDGKALNDEGSLAGSTLDLMTALKNYMRFCGLSLEEALPAATANPAAMVRIDGVCGMIKEGMRADLIVLDSPKSLNIEKVWCSGTEV